MDARNAYASVDDVGSGYESRWNNNYEANALTNRDVFRIFRDGVKASNTYRVEPAGSWWLRSLYYGSFLYVTIGGYLNNSTASNDTRVRPSVRMHEMYMHLKVMLVLHLVGMQIVK